MNSLLSIPSWSCIKQQLVFALSIGHRQGQKRRQETSSYIPLCNPNDPITLQFGWSRYDSCWVHTKQPTIPPSEKMPEIQIPSGTWMVSLGPGASQQGDCLPVLWLSSFWRQVATQPSALACWRHPGSQPAKERHCRCTVFGHPS